MQKIVTDLLRQWNLNPYVWNFLLIAAALLVGVTVSFFLRLFIRQKTGTEMKFSLVQSLLRHLSGPVAFLIPLFFLMLSSRCCKCLLRCGNTSPGQARSS